MRICDWLPADALVGPAVRDPIERAVAEWSSGWFAGRADLRLTALEPRPPLWAAELGRAAWHRRGAAVSLAVPPPALSRLRGKALDMRNAVRPETERDAALLRGFEARMVADLAARIETALGICGRAATDASPAADPWAGGAAALCAIVAEPDGAEALRLAVPLEHAIAFRKKGLPPARRRPRPTRRDAALAHAKVRIGARLGSAALTLGEFRSLAPGDVLVLDRGLDQPVELLADGGTQCFARGRLDRSERMTLIVEM